MSDNQNVPEFIQAWIGGEKYGFVDWRRVEAHYHIYVGANDPLTAIRLAYNAALEEARKERAA